MCITWKLLCRFVIIIIYTNAFFVMLYRDFHGKKAEDPGGFGGAVATILALSFIFAILYGAGLFD